MTIRSFLRLGLFLAVTGTEPTSARAESTVESFPPDGSRVVFLGDSITYSGRYISLLDAHWRSTRPTAKLEFLNLGLPSETASGLSEPDHPFPRPDVHERLDRVLAQTRPDVVVVGYGMNDGIYYPFSEERFAAYKSGIDRLIKKVRGAGAKLVLLTPPAFDPQPFRKKGKLLPSDAEKFAWFAIYADYDDVMKRYSDWILAQRERVDGVIDLHTPVQGFLAAQRKDDPDFAASSDGVHLDDVGHAVLAGAILTAWGKSPAMDLDKILVEKAHARQIILRNAWLSHVGHTRPGVKPGLSLAAAEVQAAALALEFPSESTPPSK